jgi:plasmid stabilization system protein ParE
MRSDSTRRPRLSTRMPWLGIKPRSPQAAARFEAELERVLLAIAANPSMFPAYDDEHRFSMLRRSPYSVVYQALPGQVHIVAVAHSHRSAGYWRGRA